LRFQYIDERKERAGSGFVPGPSVVRGVDVSSFSGTVDWTQVKAAGYAFGIARLGGGATFIDPQFDHNWAGVLCAICTRFSLPSWQSKHLTEGT
jgi:hypothetical protein